MRKRIGSNFVGCFPRNGLPTKLRLGCYVINLDTGLGTHWTAAVVDRPNIIYFDSFGFPPPIELINRKGNKCMLYSTHRIQNIQASSCGWYCIYFLMEFNKKDKVDILLKFENNGSSNNETVLEKYVRENLSVD